MNEDILNSLKARLEGEFGGKGWEVELMEQLHKLRQEKVANIVSSYCSFMKISEINEIIGEVMEQWKKGKLEEFDKQIAAHAGVGFYEASHGYPLAKEAMISKAEEKLMAQVIEESERAKPFPKPPSDIALVGPSEFLGAAAANLMQDTIEKERASSEGMKEYQGAVKVEVIEPHEVLPPEPSDSLDLLDSPERRYHGDLVEHPPEAEELAKADPVEDFLDDIISSTFDSRKHGRKARVVKQVERKEGTEGQEEPFSVDKVDYNAEVSVGDANSGEAGEAGSTDKDPKP